jgi:hypothetical protein
MALVIAVCNLPRNLIDRVLTIAGAGSPDQTEAHVPMWRGAQLYRGWPMSRGEESGVKEQNPGLGWTELGCLCPEISSIPLLCR